MMEGLQEPASPIGCLGILGRESYHRPIKSFSLVYCSVAGTLSMLWSDISGIL